MQINNVRFIIAAITTFSAYAVYVSRVNLSIAIIAMVEDHHAAAVSAAAAAAAPDNQAHSARLQTTMNSSSQATFNSSDVNQYRPPVGQPNNTSTLTSLLLPALAANLSGVSTAGNKQPREPLTTIFPTSKKTVEAPLISQLKFDWDQIEQGHILGAFFYGYILFQIPGARIAESVGAKWIIMAASAGSAVISLAFPLSTQLNSIHLLMVLRFVMGLCQSAFFPAAYVLFCRWLPERERSVLLPIMFIGSNMGSISTYIMSSYLISSSYGWPSVFYLSGLVCALCSLLWCIFGSNGPDDNWLITDGERRFIERNVNNQSSESNSLDELPSEGLEEDDDHEHRLSAEKQLALYGPGNKFHRSTELSNGTAGNATKAVNAAGPINAPASTTKRAFDPPVPSWPKLVSSIPVWTLILSMYGNEWSNVVICYELPTYLNTALNLPIEQNGVFNSFFQLSYTVASPIMSSLGAYMLDRHLLGMRKIHVRKLFQSLATFGQLACFVSVPICGKNEGLIIMFMFAAIVLKACANAGDIMVPGDLSPEYAGTIFAFANSIGNTAGFFVPLLAGVFVVNPYERDQWTPFWLTTATIMGCSGLIFLIFGETRRQDFSLDDQADELEDRPANLAGSTNKPACCQRDDTRTTLI